MSGCQTAKKKKRLQEKNEAKFGTDSFYFLNVFKFSGDRP